MKLLFSFSKFENNKVTSLLSLFSQSENQNQCKFHRRQGNNLAPYFRQDNIIVDYLKSCRQRNDGCCGCHRVYVPWPPWNYYYSAISRVLVWGACIHRHGRGQTMGMHLGVHASRVCEPMRDLILTSTRAPFLTSYASSYYNIHSL